MRVAEAHAVLRAVRGENVSLGARSSSSNREGEKEAEDERAWKEIQASVDASRPVMVGHSLGGSAAVSPPFLHLTKTETRC